MWLWSLLMAALADLMTFFSDCGTIEDTNERFKELYFDLTEAHRRSMVSIMEEEAAAAAEANKIRLEDLGVTPAEIREWAASNKIEVPVRGRISQETLHLYVEMEGTDG